MKNLALKLSLAAALTLSSLTLMTPQAQACGGYGMRAPSPQEHIAVQRYFSSHRIGNISRLETKTLDSTRALVAVTYVRNGSSRSRLFVVRLQNAQWTVTGSMRAA